MTTSTGFLSLLTGLNVRKEEGYFVVARDCGSDSSNYESIKEFLIRQQGYTKSLEDEISEQDVSFYVDLSLDSWSGRKPPLYFTQEEFWSGNHESFLLPSFYYILEGGICSDHPDAFIDRIVCYILWCNLFRKLDDDDNKTELRFFIGTELGLKRYSFTLSRTLENSNILNLSAKSYSDASYLLDELDKQDGHISERLRVMRATLSEIFELVDDDDLFGRVAKHSGKFRKKFDDNYDIYTHQYSVNKILSDIDEKHNEYTSKIVESVSGSQAKALAVPGAVIAVGALARSVSVSSVLLILLGLMLVYIVTKISNEIYRQALRDMQKQYTKAFARYTRLPSGSEVVESSNETLAKLDFTVKKAQGRLDFIDLMALSVLLVGVFYSSIQIFGPDFMFAVILALHELCTAVFD